MHANAVIADATAATNSRDVSKSCGTNGAGGIQPDAASTALRADARAAQIDVAVN